MKYISEQMAATEQLEDFCRVSIHDCGDIRCYDQLGILHNEDGPAYISSDSKRYVWYKHGLIHREGGPAIFTSSSEGWVINGLYHREDGPACTIFSSGCKLYYLHGKMASEAEVRALGKMK